MTPRELTIAINREAVRTDGRHSITHLLFIGGQAYAVPRRQSGWHQTPRRATIADVAAGKWTVKAGTRSRCDCAACIQVS